MTPMVNMIASQTVKAPFKCVMYPVRAISATFTASDRNLSMFSDSFYKEISNFWGCVNA